MVKKESRSILAGIDVVMMPLGETLSIYECLGFRRFRLFTM